MGRKLLLSFLLVFFFGSAAIGQNFNYQPDVYVQWRSATQIANSPNANTSTGYGDALPATTHDRWNIYQYAINNGVWPSGQAFSVKSAQNILRVRINHDTMLHQKYYKYRFSFDVYKNTGNSTVGPEQVTLDLEYYPDSLKGYQDMALYKFSGYQYFHAVLTNIQDLTAPAPNYPTVQRGDLARNFIIETELQFQRYDQNVGALFARCLTPTTSALKVEWGTAYLVPGNACSLNDFGPGDIQELKPIDYELEWTYVDDYWMDNGIPKYRFSDPNNSSPIVSYDFRQNSTRVRTSKRTFDIPLLYEHGAIVFRVRTVRPDPTTGYKEVVYSGWNLSDNGTVQAGNSCFAGVGYIITSPHAHDSLNWQYTINFAEEGKYKHVINYFDGALKDRQTQTKINSDPNTIIAVDKVYDYEGRPSVQSLPIPMAQDRLQYRTDVLLNHQTSQPYKAADIDPLGCTKPDSFAYVKSNAQANQYYSAQSTDTAGMQKYVPDAKGYPLVQTVFSPDNTNKVLFQGGAGLDHQIWRGHGTRNDYTRATQNELNRLLGTEAGQYQFYPQQVVTDPNGQTSYSILDPAGKVVATGLAGIPDTIGLAIDTLPNYSRGSAYTEDLLYNLTPELTSNARFAENTFYKDATGPDSFRYSVAVKPFPTGCNSQYLTPKSNYTVTVSDECGTPMMVMGDTVRSAATKNNGNDDYQASAIVGTTLLTGKHLVQKALTFPEYAADSQVKAFVKANEPSCYNDEHHFIRKSVESNEFPCEDAVTTNMCDQRRRQMLSELWPGAKYGQYTQNLSGLYQSGAANSIFTPLQGPTTMTYFVTQSDVLPNYNSGAGININSNCNDENFLLNDGSGTAFMKGVKSSIDPSCTSFGYPGPDGSVYFPIGNISSGTPIFYISIGAIPVGAISDTNLVLNLLSDYDIDPYRIDELFINGQSQGVPDIHITPQGSVTTYATILLHNIDIYSPLTITLRYNYTGFGYSTPSDTWIQTTFDYVTKTYTTPNYLRYQFPCATLPTPITINGQTYTSLQNIDPQTLIDNFSDTIAEALLPLHPEYCKLNTCDDGSFEEELENITTWQEAVAKNRFTLDGLIYNDPLNSNAPGAAPTNEYNQLAYPKGTQISLNKTIQTLALESAYCDAGNVNERVICAAILYNNQIANFTFINDNVKQVYFEHLKALYLANRAAIKQASIDGTSASCGPCANVRMSTIGDPVFPQVFNSSGDIAIPGMPSWMEDIFNQANAGTLNLNGIPSQVVDSVNAIDDSLADGRLDAMMKGLANCSLNPSDISALRGQLETALNSGIALTPTVVKNCITAANISLSDLCHPFLVDYGLFDTNPGNAFASFDCADQSFYEGIQYFFNQEEIKHGFKNAVGSTPFVTNLYPLTGMPFDVKVKQYYSSINSGGNNESIRFIGSRQNVTIGSSIYSSVKLAVIPKSGYVGPNDTLIFNIVGRSNMTTNITDGWWFEAYESHCINNDNQALKNGLNARYTSLMIGRVVPFPVSGVIDTYYIWNNKIPIMIESADNELGQAITCMDLKVELDSFNANVVNYSYSNLFNHPLYEITLTNYLNYKFKKTFVFDDYYKLMKGCAISDQVEIKKSVYPIEFLVSSQTLASALWSQLGDLKERLSVITRFDYGWANVIDCDWGNIPKDSLLWYKNAFTNVVTSSTIGGSLNYMVTINADNWVHIFTPDANAYSLLPAQLSSYGSIWYTASIPVYVNGSYQNWYVIQVINSSTNPIDRANFIHSIKTAVAQYPGSYEVYNHELLRPDDYSSTARQNYLAHIYSQGGGHQQWVSSITPAGLSTVAPFTNQTLTYKDPWSSKMLTDLHAYTQPASHPGYNRLSQILTSVNSYYSSHPFPGTINNTTTGGLSVFKKANGTYWYRFFDNNTDKLYNVYLIPPIGQGISPSNYTYSGVQMIQGGDSVNRFRVTVNYNGAPYACEGYTDFTIGAATRLSNVILLEKPGANICIDTMDCEKEHLLAAIGDGKVQYALYFDSVTSDMRRRMLAYVTANSKDTLLHTGTQQRYHHTLYYYDLAGNLTKTVPPAGVHPLPVSSNAAVNAGREANNPSSIANIVPQHQKASVYRYNSLNQLKYQQTPDGGITHFFYDAAGRLAFSQNSKQRPQGNYSYILYDDQGRTVETGVIKLGCTLPVNPSVLFDSTHCEYASNPNGQNGNIGIHPDFVENIHDESKYPTPIIRGYITAKPRTEVVITVYDTVKVALETINGEGLDAQENLRKRVSAVLFFPSIGNSSTGNFKASSEANYTFGAFYSYDLTGNVKTLTYDYKPLKDLNQRYKRIDYDYDLLSGKVNLLSYNRSKADQFYHKYDYDADNRITKAYSSTDGITWNTEARYSYYKHGPLAKAQLGHDKIQSLEYAYTIQGWLKAINGEVLRPDKDMGKNGFSGDATYARDIVAHALDYYKNDYSPIVPTATPINFTPPTKELFNGNIVRQTTTTAGLGDGLQRSYRYDQLQRIKLASNATINAATLAVTPSQLYQSTYSYDPDGNLQGLTRLDGAGAAMDNFTYHYVPGNNNNRLLQVSDAVTAASSYSDIKSGQPADNYGYDAIGNLISDKQEGLKIEWNSYGKAKTIRDSAANQILSFTYDGAGNRIYKDVIKTLPNNEEDHRGEYYVRDASGNILAVYRTHGTVGKLKIIEATNGPIAAEPSFPPFVEGEVYPYPSFPSLFVEKAVNKDGPWVLSTTNGKTAGFYLSRDAELLSQITYGDPSYLNSIPAWQAASPSNRVLSRALATPQGNNMTQPVFESAFQFSTPMERLLTHYADNMSDARCDQVWNSFGQLFDRNNIPGSVAALMGNVQGNGIQMYLAAHMRNVLNNEIAQNGDVAVHDFWTAAIADSAFFFDNDLRTNTGFNSKIMSVLGSAADTGGLVHFFSNGWSGSSNWLSKNTTPDRMLATVLEAEPSPTIASLLTQTGGPAILDGVIAEMPELTAGEYLAKVVLKPEFLTKIDMESVFGEGTIADTIRLAEQHLYGSSRLAVHYRDSAGLYNAYKYNDASAHRHYLNGRRTWWSAALGDYIDSTQKEPWGHADAYSWKSDRQIGFKHFELTDHLGNVLATVLDRKTGSGHTGYGTLYDHWHADIAGAQDYYPFGMLMPGRVVGMEAVIDQVAVNGGMGITGGGALSEGQGLTEAMDNFTMEFWVNPTAQHELDAELPYGVEGIWNQRYVIFPKVDFGGDAGAGVSVGTNGVSVYEHAGGYLPPLLVWNGSISGWTHVAIVYVNKQPHLYINGVLTHTGLVSPRAHVYPSTGLLGTPYGDGYHGQLDEVRVWNYAKTPAEIQAQMNGEVPTYSAGLLAYWKMNETSGTVLADATGNGYDATLNNPNTINSWSAGAAVAVLKAGDKYRFGFNGQQKDNEVAGVGNHLDFKFRGYDSRAGRFWSVDPLAASYPWNSTYAFAENRVIDGIDLEGLEYSPSKIEAMRDNTSVLTIANPIKIEQVSYNQRAQLVKLPPTVIDQDYSHTIYGSKAGKAYVNTMLEQEAAFVPGGSVGIKKLKGEEITRGDIAWELAGILPVGKLFSIPGKVLRVSSYAFKHVAPKIPWDDVIRATKNGPAKFIHGTNVEKITKEAWDAGERVNNGKPWKVYKSAEVIGASSGKETKYMRVELTESAGELHGSPITESQYRKLTK